MNTDDQDRARLREFRDGIAEPGQDRLARMRSRVQGRAAAGTPRRWSDRGVLVPAVAAASVLAVAVGAGIVAFDGSDGGVPAGGSPPASSVPAPTSTEPRAADKTNSQPDPAAPAEHEAAVTVLEQFAAAAGSGPAPITAPAGCMLYIRSQGYDSPVTMAPDSTPEQYSRRIPYLHEMWVDVQGSIVLMIRRTDDGEVTIVSPDPNNPKDNGEAEAAAARAEFAAKGPSLRQSTPEFLAALPTDPDAMLDTLKSLTDEHDSWSKDRVIFDALRELLYVTEPLITPAVRASLYRAIAKLDSVTSTGQPIKVDGRTVYAIAQTERGGRYELLLDAETGRVVGDRSSHTETGPEPSHTALWTHAVVTKPGDTP